MSVHISGIAGKGMAPVAGLALTGGYHVTGDDLVENHRIEPLRRAGAEVVIGQNVDPPAGSTVHVLSSLISSPCSDVPQRSRLGFVSDVMSSSGNNVLGIAGSVGKSTAAGIIWVAHRRADPACYVGADLPGTLCGGWHRASTTAVVEADEYKDAYLDIAADSVVLLNVIANHADHFGEGTTGFSRSFAAWVRGLELDREQVLMSASAATQLAADGFKVDAVVLDTDAGGGDWQLEIRSANSTSTVLAVRRGPIRDTFEVPLTGAHAAAAAGFGILTARRAGLSDTDIREGLQAAEFPWRRQSLVHSSIGVWVYDDNARLPDQFIVTISALRQRHPNAHLVAIISPWGRLNRRDLTAWAAAGSSADTLVVLPVGEAGATSGGAELDDADERLVRAVEARDRIAQTLRAWGDLPHASGETVYVTAGYDAQYELFRGAHEHLRDRYP